jgi:hypothetical protein
MVGKWLQLLKEAVPVVTRVAMIFNPDTGFVLPLDHEIVAAQSLGVTAKLAAVQDDKTIEEVIAAQACEPGLPGSFNVAHREVIVAATVRIRLTLWSEPNGRSTLANYRRRQSAPRTPQAPLWPGNRRSRGPRLPDGRICTLWAGSDWHQPTHLFRSAT